MKIKNMSILLFILTFAGVVLVGGTQALAELGNGICDSGEKDSFQCIELGVYVIEHIPAASGAWWKEVDCPDAGGKCQKWTYTASCTDKGKSWSHLSMIFETCGNSTIDAGYDGYIVNTDPPNPTFGGAGKDEKSCNYTVEDHEEFLKWTPKVDCPTSTPVEFAVYATIDSKTDCDGVVTLVKAGPECLFDKKAGRLLAPGCDICGTGLLADVLKFPGGVNVYIDPGTLGPGCVEMYNVDIGKFTEAKPCDPYLFIGGEPGTNGVSPIDLSTDELTGPKSSGGVFRITGKDGAYSPIYGWGNQYWCFDETASEGCIGN